MLKKQKSNWYVRKSEEKEKNIQGQRWFIHDSYTMRNINTAAEKQVPSENIYSEIGGEDVPSISSS